MEKINTDYKQRDAQIATQLLSSIGIIWRVEINLYSVEPAINTLKAQIRKICWTCLSALVARDALELKFAKRRRKQVQEN